MTTPNHPNTPVAFPSSAPAIPTPSVVPTPAVPEGWYGDPNGQPVQRYWDGSRWTEHTAPQQSAPSAPQYQQAPAQQYQPPIVINNVTSSSAASVAMVGVVGGRRRVNHLLHLILTLLTGGLWIFVWIYLAVRR